MKLGRREYMAAVAAAATAELESSGYEPEDVEPFAAWKFSPTRLVASGEVSHSSWLVEPDDFDSIEAEVFYDPQGRIAIATEGDGPQVRNAGAAAYYNPQEARELAAILYITADAAEAYLEGDTDV